MKNLLIAAMGLLAACYSPDLSGVSYTCVDSNPYCPDGLVCIGGTCLPPGTDPGIDGGMTGGDGGSNYGPPKGCKNSTVGTALGGEVYACPGKFSPGPAKASLLCATGYAICTKASTPYGRADLALCKTLPGFFGSNQIGAVPKGSNNTSGFVCQAPNGSQDRLYTGCGRGTGGDIFDVAPMCGEFSQAVYCLKSTPWDCNTAPNLDGAANSSALDGVLCCKP